MGLRDTVNTLQQEAVSEELRWLREMRKFVGEHTDEWLKAEWEKLYDFQETPEGKSPEGCERICARGAELHETAALVKFYGDVLKCAESIERKEQGGAEKNVRRYWKRMKAIENGIKKSSGKKEDCRFLWRIWRRSETYGDFQERNDPDAASDGGQKAGHCVFQAEKCGDTGGTE